MRKKYEPIHIMNGLINGVLDDLAEYNSTTKSIIVETIVWNDLFMKTIPPAWQDHVSDMYAYDLTIGVVLSNIWRDTDRMEFMNMQGVVEYACMQTWMCNTLPNASSEEWPHFIGLLEALSRYLSKSFNRKGSFQQRKDAARLAEITDAYKEKDVRISLVEIYYIILRYWDDPEVNLKGKTAVYNLLQSMALVQTGWRNDPDDRIILMRKLRKTWIS